MNRTDPQAGLVLSAIALRKIIGWLGAALPVLCAAYASVPPVDFLPSISDYYYTRIHALFVGILCILGASMFSYHGYTKAEDGLAKLGGLCAVGTALCPTEPLYQQSAPVVAQLIGESAKLFAILHGVFACGLFTIFMVFSAVFFTRTSESDQNDPLTFSRGFNTLIVTVFGFRANPYFNPELNPGKRRRNLVYRLSARLIAFSILAVLIVAVLRAMRVIQSDPFQQFIFACETVALWAFAASWLTKAEQFSFLKDPPISPSALDANHLP